MYIANANHRIQRIQSIIRKNTEDKGDKIMLSIFKNDNEWNEKTIIGALAFLVMVIFAIIDLITGYVGKDLVINEFIYDSFTLLVLGCFGIAGLEKFAGSKRKDSDG